ncbi:DNA recombination protein RmuC [Verticiella sediminum]|uniref:DNA recombination protein RmuC n=1 Tax=Verticiella sediminum TaxID=1247510 RepID=A0A556A8D1_9BURK|nr:DNA recombination protein RmuC [Verticiella sediminum]TSH89142.1 DNA recombination protein RmuC [Verticiella sediminum]
MLLGILALAVVLARRQRPDPRLDLVLATQEKLERLLRADLADAHRGLRSELEDSARALRAELMRSVEGLRTVMSHDAGESRRENAQSLHRFAEGFGQQLAQLTEANERRMADMRQTLEARLAALQNDNAERLEQMRRTVDEKLHDTLEKRLGESFRLVSERLEAVHQGLGDMRQLAAGVGDLQRVLVNVKSRGTWGEVQLARLVEDSMTPDQYARNVKPVPGSNEVVEFAIRLPGRDDDAPVWLPIDAKFPKEDYERLVLAHERADEDAMRVTGTAFERAVEAEARRITGKYVAPPHTTDFAIMFLPTEGLYAEVLRRPGLMDRLFALRVSVAGPTNLAALLNSLQMGFRTLAIEQRSSEVWQVLRAVKTEFDKFGDTLAGVKKALETASNRIGQTETRTRAMLRSLRSVEALPEQDAVSLLGLPEAPAATGDDAGK